MSQKLTQLRLWFNALTTKEKAEFKQNIIDASGINERTFYRYLNNEAPKLTKHIISTFCGIDTNQLYKTN